jgi:hypothetical protein
LEPVGFNLGRLQFDGWRSTQLSRSLNSSAIRLAQSFVRPDEFSLRAVKPDSLLGHYLRFLAAGGLVVQELKGPAVFNRAERDWIESLAGILLRACCAEAKPAGSAEPVGTAHQASPGTP